MTEAPGKIHHREKTAYSSMEETGKKKIFYAELAYCFGLLCSTIGIALMERADFGVSMVVAPAYLLHLKLVQIFPWFTFGTAEYTFQALLLLIIVLVLRRIRLSWFFSFVTAVLVGLVLDIVMIPVARFPVDRIWQRLIWYLLGMQFCSFGIALMFHTYISPEVYELFVKLLSRKAGMELHKFKTVYDCASLLLGIVFSFLFFGFGHFEGVKWGTIFCALINGKCIGLWSGFFEKRFTFSDALPLRKYFEDQC